MSDSFSNFRSFPNTRRREESPLADLAGAIACPTNATPAVVLEDSFQSPKNYMTVGTNITSRLVTVGQAIPPARSLASEVLEFRIKGLCLS